MFAVLCLYEVIISADWNLELKGLDYQGSNKLA